jgi:hypothetical protein
VVSAGRSTQATSQEDKHERQLWATQDAAIAMGHAGKAVGRRQAKKKAIKTADGFARGRKYGQDESVAAMQAQLDALNQQRNAARAVERLGHGPRCRRGCT